MPTSWKKIENTFGIEKVGAFLMDSIAKGVYKPDEVLREYVQNAVDAYVAMEKSGHSAARTIQLRIDKNNASVAIMDLGIGMDQADIEYAQSIAVSTKRDDTSDYAGFRGIGIWSGLAACEKIEVITTKLGCETKFRLTIDCKGIIDNYTKPIHIGQLMSDRIAIDSSPAESIEHFTMVKLVNVKKDDDYAQLLDSEAMAIYASQNLPVEFAPDWYKDDDLDYGKSLSKILSGIPNTQNYMVTINGEPVYRYFPVEVEEPTGEYIVDESGKRIAYAWSARSKASRTISLSRDKMRAKYEVTGFSVRVKNIAIGGRLLFAPDSLRQLLKWFVGEIYIIDPTVKPNTERSNFDPSTRSSAEEAIKQFYGNINARARAWSIEINAQEDCRAAIKKVDELIDCFKENDAEDKIKKIEGEIAPLKTNIAKFLNQSKMPDSKVKNSKKKTEKGGSQDSPDKLEIDQTREALNKPEIKQLLNQASGKLKTLDIEREAYLQARRSSIADPLSDNASVIDVENFAPAAPPDNEKKKASSNSLTATSTGKSITVADVISWGSGVDPQHKLPGLADDDKVDFKTVFSAFQTAAAKVLGEGNALYIEIFRQLPEELRRRGINNDL